MEIVLPKNENRIFSGNHLENGIKYINVEDNNLDKSHVMVSVNIGSLGNPHDYQGLAHFLEHMLFLGSKKYPGENSFEKFLNENGGSSNAYTDTFETVYYFSVFNNKLEQAMDMFSRFFIDPLFHEDSVNREINAIQSEHNKNVQQDIWRLHHFIGLTSKEGSMLNKFGTGNLQSLQKDGIRNRMIEFYNQYYVSSNINIVTISSIKNKEVQKMIKKSFLNIDKKVEPKLKIEKPFFENKNQSFYLKSISKTYRLNYYWDIPAHVTNYLYTHSPHLISHLISSDTDNSLKQFLIKKGLIKSLYASVHDEGIFTVSISLSKLENWKEVDSYFRYYMNDLKNKNWNHIGNYYKKKDKILFDYTSKIDSESLGLILVTNLIYYPIDKAYIGPSVVENINTDEIDSLLKEYLTFDRVNIVISSDRPKETNLKLGDKLTEPYYDLEYNKLNLELEEPKKFNYQVITDNPFLNINPIIYNKDEVDIKPRLINIKNSSLKNWFGNVFKFGESKVYSILAFTNLEFIFEIDNYLNTIILLNYMNRKISEEFNLASEIGFSTSLSLDSNDSIITIRCNGHNDKFNEYFNLVIDFIKNFKFDDEDSVMIKTIIDATKDSYLNIKKANPWNYSSYLEKLKINNHAYTIENIVEYLNTLTIDNFHFKLNETKNRIFYESKFTSFFYGNIEEDKLFDSTENIKIDFISIEKPKNKINMLQDIDEFHPNNQEKDNFVQYSYHIGPFNPMDNLLLLVLAISMSQPFYDQLRTKQQFGYLVSCSRVRYQNNYYLTERVQSTKTINEIENAIIKFNNDFITSITEDEYNKYVKATENILRERENSTAELYNKFVNEIIENNFLFNRDDLLLRKIKDLSFGKFKQFYKDKVLNRKVIKTYIKTRD